MRITRIEVARAAIAKMGIVRAIESLDPAQPPIPSPWGCVGVDCPNGGRFRARIRVCDALSGRDTRVTLGYFDELEDADWAYRAAHIALHGSLSWAASDLSEETIDQLRSFRKG